MPSHKMLLYAGTADVNLGRGDLILKEKERIKQESIRNRKMEYEKLKLKNKKINLALN